MGNNYVVGIDSGSQNTKAVALLNGEIVATAIVATEFDAKCAAEKAINELLDKLGIGKDSVQKIAATGTGRNLIDFADMHVNEVISAAKGARSQSDKINMVLDMGAETSRVIALDEHGAAKNYVVNDRCASGAGTFIETVARALQIQPEEMGDIALKADKDIMLKAQCVVFVESEVISLIHQKETRENIANGVHNGIGNRISARAVSYSTESRRTIPRTSFLRKPMSRLLPDSPRIPFSTNLTERDARCLSFPTNLAVFWKRADSLKKFSRNSR